MALLICDQGEGIALDALTGKVPVVGLTLKLFSNDVTPAKTVTETSYTEMDDSEGNGYAAVALTPALWTTSTGAPSFTIYAEQTFTLIATPTIPEVYGYMITDSTGKLVWSERFVGAPLPLASGDDIKVTPRIEAS